jgi:hypothetical protein
MAEAAPSTAQTGRVSLSEASAPANQFRRPSRPADAEGVCRAILRVDPGHGYAWR